MSKHRVVEQRDASHWARRIGVAGTAVVLSVGTCVLAASPAGATTTTVNDQSHLQSAMSDATNDTVVLGADISITDGSNVVVSTSLAKTLDLNGHSLSISGVSGNAAAIENTGAASLTIEDTVGTGSLAATGGSNGAGIGGSNTESGGTLAVHSGTVNATGGSNAAGVGGGAGGNGGAVNSSGGLLTANGGTNGAGVGGGNGGAGAAVSSSGIANPSSAQLNAVGGAHGAGIGGGNGGAAGTLTMNGGGVTAEGNTGGSGVGGGDGIGGGTVNVNSGTLFGYGGANGAGIGGGNNGSGGSLTIGADGSVTVRDGGGTSSAVGQGSGGASSGSLSNSGGLVVDTSHTLRLLSGASFTNTNTIFNKGTITAGGTAGTLQNDGTILNTGTIQNNGVGGGGTVTVSHHNYRLDFDVNGGPSATPPSQYVYAATMLTANETLPTVSAPAGGFFLGWYTAATGGTQVTTSTDLTTLLASGPSSTTLFAHYRLPQTINFPIIGNQTFGAPDFAVSATATSGLPVSFAAGPSSVCTMSGPTTVHIVAAGGCGITASQAGNADWLPAANVQRTFQILTGVVTVTATGTQTFGGQPTFTPTGSLPAGVSLAGALSCTGLVGGATIRPTLAPNNYTINSATCGGIALTGANSNNYKMVLGNGTFTVTPANVNVTATGSQTYLGSATFAPQVTPPPNVTVSGSLTCTRVLPLTPIDPNLAVGSYTIDSSSCSGLSLTGTQAFGYQIVYHDGPYTVRPAPVVVTATGTAQYGGTPTFTPQASPPSGITVAGTLTCTKLTGNVPISGSLAVSNYTIDATSCSGLSLTGTGASNYQVKYANGPFTVTKANLLLDTHTNSTASANQAHKYTFSTSVTNTANNAPVSGIKVTVTVAFNGTFKATCSALTNAIGVATCSSTYFLLFLSPGHAYTATTAATANYNAGSANGKLGT